MQITAVRTARIRAGEMEWRDFLDRNVPDVAEKTVVAITSKVVSLCEGRAVAAETVDKDELIRAEADWYLPRELSASGYAITIKRGILIPAAGIDESNADGNYVLWPEDVQRRANEAREFLAEKWGRRELAVIITDSKTTPLRWGTTGVCLAASGIEMLRDYIGETDLFGREMVVTKANVGDGLAAAAVVAMGEGREGMPIALITELGERVSWTGRNPTEEELQAERLDRETDLYGALLSGVEWRKGGGGWREGGR